MAEKKRREEYENEYEFRKDHLWKTVKSDDDLGYPKIISYYVKSGSTPVSGKVAKIKDIEFPSTMNIMTAFKLVEELMTTKKLTKGRRNTLKPTMLKLEGYEEYDLISLLSYLREEYQVFGNRGEVQLSWKELFLLKEGKFKKAKKKTKK